MPWSKRSVMDIRKEFVERVLAHERSKSSLCREYGISRPTGDKWIARYLSGEPLSDRSHSHKAPGKTPEDIEQKVVEYRKLYPAIGATKLREIMCKEGIADIPCARTVNNILKRNNLISKEASLAATPYIRFEKSYPNEMWQADYKGHFELLNKERCHPLNIIDDYSRFNICCRAQKSETLGEIKPVLTELFRDYGMPFSFLCDNGNPWGTSQSTGFTGFEVWMMELGILVLHGRPLHPQTQGKDESFNRSFTRECLNGHTFSDMASAQQAFSDYRDFYNNKRPHHALNLETPAVRYSASQRKMPEEITEWEYGPEYKPYKVKDTGYITIGGQGYFLSEGFRGKTVAVRESHIPGQLTICFRQFRIARLDPDKRVFTQRRAYLIDGDPRDSDSESVN